MNINENTETIEIIIDGELIEVAEVDYLVADDYEGDDNIATVTTLGGDIFLIYIDPNGAAWEMTATEIEDEIISAMRENIQDLKSERKDAKDYGDKWLAAGLKETISKAKNGLAAMESAIPSWAHTTIEEEN